MKHCATYILSRLTLLLSVMLVASCSLIFDDIPEGDFTNKGDCYVTLTISTGAKASTRGTHSDRNNNGEYDDGRDVDYENYIDIANHDYQFYLFTLDDVFIASLNTSNQLVVTPTDSHNSNSSQTYRVRGLINSDLVPAEGYKAVFVCNWGSYPSLTPGVSTLNDLQMIYNYSSSWTLSANNLIPMFGVTNNITDKPLVAGETVDIGAINLLRAMAKIEVTTADDEEEEIEYVKLVRYNSQGYNKPGNVTLESQYFEKGYYNYPTDYFPTTTLVGGANDTDEKFINMPVTGTRTLNGTSRNIYGLYIPEYQNERNTQHEPVDNPCYMQIKFQNIKHVYTLQFTSTVAGVPYAGYQVGDYYNLLRNSYYKYTVRREKFDVVVVVELVPYIGVTLDPNFGFEEFLPPKKNND